MVKTTPAFSDKAKSEPENADNDPSWTDKSGEGAADTPVAYAPEVDDTDYVYVTMPNGSTRAIPRSDVQAAQQRDADAYAAATTVANTGPDPEVYVWLADGSVERVKESTLPGGAGTNAVHGYFDRDGHTHHIVGVYPVETENQKG